MAVAVRSCRATTKAGKPCRNPRILDDGYCIVHSPKSDVSRRFHAGPDHTISPGRPRLPTRTERMAAFVDDEFPGIVAAYYDGLRATQANWHNGELKRSDAPDLAFRQQTAERLLNRIDGTPKQSVDVTGRVDHTLLAATLDASELAALRAARAVLAHPDEGDDA